MILFIINYDKTFYGLIISKNILIKIIEEKDFPKYTSFKAYSLTKFEEYNTQVVDIMQKQFFLKGKDDNLSNYIKIIVNALKDIFQ